MTSPFQITSFAKILKRMKWQGVKIGTIPRCVKYDSKRTLVYCDTVDLNGVRPL